MILMTKKTALKRNWKPSVRLSIITRQLHVNVQVQDQAEEVLHRYLNGVIKRIGLPPFCNTQNVSLAFLCIYEQIIFNISHFRYLYLKWTFNTERRNCLRQQMETFCDIAEHSGTKVCRKFICSDSGMLSNQTDINL